MNVYYMNGAGNDFMVIDARGLSLEFSELALKLCKLSGADGFMAVDYSDKADFKLHFYNADGSRGEMCGNGARCICRFAYDNGIAGESMVVQTDAGLVPGWRLSENLFKVKLNNPGVLDLNRLPETYEEAMTAVPGSDDYQMQYLLYHNGQAVLKPNYYSGVNDWVRREAEFNTPDVVDIGYPTADGSNGAQVDMTPYVITSFCEYPDEAWDFIESILAPEAEFDSRVLGRHGIPVLKEQFMQVCESEYDSLFEIYFDGGMSWGTYNPEYDDLEAEMREPGIRKFFTYPHNRYLLKVFERRRR